MLSSTRSLGRALSSLVSGDATTSASRAGPECSSTAALPFGGGLKAGGGLLHELWASRTWRLYPLYLLYVTGLTLLAPLTPTLMTDFFASRAGGGGGEGGGGGALRCEDYGRGEEPAACVAAHASVVQWVSWTSFFSNSLISFLLMPLIGDWSDRFGRRPFLALGVLLQALPVAVLLAHARTEGDVSLLWYFPANAVSGGVSSISVAMALLADCVSPAYRAAAFGALLASFSLGILVGPSLGGLLLLRLPSFEDAFLAGAWLALGTCGGVIVLILLCVPETRSSGSGSAGQLQQHLGKRAADVAPLAAGGIGVSAGTEGGGAPAAPRALPLSATWRAVRILLRSPLYQRLTACLMLSGAVAEAIQDLLIQYLQLEAGFGPRDQAALFVLYGALTLLINTLLLRALLSAVGERRVLVLGLAAYTVQNTMLVFARGRGLAFAAITVGTLGSVSFPAISALKSNHAGAHEQGAVQGALAAARALAMGVGPLAFAAVFSAFTRQGGALPYLPGAPFVLAALLSAASVACAASIKPEHMPVCGGGGGGSGGGGGHDGDDGAEGGETSQLLPS